MHATHAAMASAHDRMATAVGRRGADKQRRRRYLFHQDGLCTAPRYCLRKLNAVLGGSFFLGRRCSLPSNGARLQLMPGIHRHHLSILNAI